MLNVIANLWGLNNNGNGSVNASPIAKKKKRKNHHKKNKSDVKNNDVKNSSSSSNDDDDDDNDGDDDGDDNDIKIIAKKTTNTTNVNSNDDDIDDLYKADIKDVSHQIIEVVRALSKKDYRCINKDLSELFSGILLILLLSFFHYLNHIIITR
jgi:hypothetical protein